MNDDELRACNACDWTGPVGDTVWLGLVGPLCPVCRETTDIADPPADGAVTGPRARRIAQLEVACRRYEVVRRLHPQQFADLWRKNLQTGTPFDTLVDALMRPKDGVS